MRLLGLLLYLLSLSVSTGSRRPKRDSKGHLKKATDTLVQTNAALMAVKTYKDQSRYLTDIIQKTDINTDDFTKGQQSLQKFSKFVKFGKFLSYFGGAAAVLSIVLAFIPQDDTVKRTVLQIDSKVDSLSSQLDDVRNSLIAKIEVTAYSASYMEYEFNVKNTWAFWIQFVSPQLPTGSEREVDEIQLARLMTSFTEKFEDNKVSDSLRNLHRVLVESGPSFGKNILDLVIISTKCSVSSISEIRALYETLFVQGSLLTMRYLVFKKFPESSVKQELESINKMFIASNYRFEKELKYCYQKWRETAGELIREELNSGAKDTVEDLSDRLKDKLTLQLPWITWYPVVYNRNDYWDSNKEGYINMSGDFIQESGADKHVVAMFTPIAERPWPSTAAQCMQVNGISSCCPTSSGEDPCRDVCSRRHSSRRYSYSCVASRYSEVIASMPNMIGSHVLRAYYVNNDKAKDNWKYGRPDPNTFHPMMVGEEICRVGTIAYQKNCEMRISISLDLRENQTDPCEGNPCGRHGSCYPKWEYSSEVLCFCHYGFSGEFCQDDLQKPIEVPSFANIKVGAVDLVSTFYGLRDELFNVQRNLSAKIDALELTIEAFRTYQTQELRETRIELANSVQRLTESVQTQTDAIQDNLNDLRNQFDAEAQLLYDQLFYADERKVIHLVSDYHTELLTNKLRKRDFLQRMAVLNAPSVLNFDLVRRRYFDWLNGRGSIDGRGGIVAGFKRKYWLKYQTLVDQYKHNVAVVKKYVINEFSWFVKGWREYEMLAFQKEVQQFSQWDDVRSIFNKKGILALQDEFGDISNSSLSKAFPNLVGLVQFYESQELKEAHKLVFDIKWNFLDNSCGELIINTGSEEHTLERGDSFDGHRVEGWCDPQSGFEEQSGQTAVCQRDQSGLLRWSIEKLTCRQFGTCCRRVKVASQEPELIDFKGIYQATDSKRNGVAVYQKEDSIGRLEEFFVFRGSSGWFLDTRISSGSALAFVPETQQKNRECPGETDKAGKWKFDHRGHWKASISTNVTCI